METDFDPLVESRLQADRYPSRHGRKLEFDQRCEAYAALYQGVAQVLVATAFGLSRQSISALTNCRRDTRRPVTMELPGYTDEGTPIIRDYVVGDLNITKLRRPKAYRKPRYQEVAAEFNRLGETAFIQAYYTPYLKARIDEAAKKRPVYGLPDPDADQYAFASIGAFEAGDWFRIDWRDEGWRYAVCKPDGSPRWDDAFHYKGDDKEKPFQTSTAVFNYLRGFVR